ncbi:unnamed protein product, partial [Brassica oleracea var. botrytis]
LYLPRLVFGQSNTLQQVTLLISLTETATLQRQSLPPAASNPTSLKLCNTMYVCFLFHGFSRPCSFTSVAFLSFDWDIIELYMGHEALDATVSTNPNFWLCLSCDG